MLVNNIARPLRYWPIDGDFVITNGPEFFNRPLYCDNSAFRVDAGDKPEFSLYVPGRGGNFRPGIQTTTGIKWLNDASQIVTRYHAGSMIYEIRDPWLGAGTLTLTVLPLSRAQGFVVRAELAGAPTPVTLIWAFGGANGMRGHRGGDIGCEAQPVSQFFQLRPAECKGNEFSLSSNCFVLHSSVATIAGIFPPGSELQIADARKWDSAAYLFTSTNLNLSLPVVIGRTALPPQTPVYFALKDTSGKSPAPAAADLTELFSAADQHRSTIANHVTVATPDPFINAAVPALNIAADAIWDDQQQSFMHGAVAWRVRLAGWRGPYTGDALGWHGRTAAHFTGFAHEQNTNPIPAALPPADEDSNLARNETALHSNGDMTDSHYDMNLVLVDAFFRHLLWTGDTNYATQMWPVIERHLAWERRLFRREFGPQKLPLYEAYAAIWASDNLGYNGGGTAHASAYNYFENTMAARVAKMIGRDPTPYQHEADLILRGMNQYLWLPGGGLFAEYKDYLGLQLVHPDPGLWTYYTVIDSDAATPAQARLLTAWLDTHSTRIPVRGANVPDEGLFTLPESNWMPYEWSLNNVVMAESAHTSLAYWEAGFSGTAFKLFKGELLQSMYQGLCPGNLGAMTSLDAARGESQRDFGDAIGINSRALVEGLFGVKPDALSDVLTITPGFPANWTFATMSHPDFNVQFNRSDSSATYQIESKFSEPMRLALHIPVGGPVRNVTVNGVNHSWNLVEEKAGLTQIEMDCEPAARWDIRVAWDGRWLPAEPEPVAIPDLNQAAASEGFDWFKPFPPEAKFKPVNLTPFFNDAVTQIFQNEYRAPRSPFCSLATPKQGIGGWCEPEASFVVDDSGLRKSAARNNGKISLPDGVSFVTPVKPAAKNILFTSQWHNYPGQVSVPLSGKSSHAFLLLAGSSNPLQSRVLNGEVFVTYADGTRAILPLRNPDNWWPIDQDYFTDDYAFRLDAPLPPRVDLKTGRIRILDPSIFKGKGGKVPGGAATVLELPLDPQKELKSLTVHATANEVVIGLMAVTLERE